MRCWRNSRHLPCFMSGHVGVSRCKSAQFLFFWDVYTWLRRRFLAVSDGLYAVESWVNHRDAASLHHFPVVIRREARHVTAWANASRFTRLNVPQGVPLRAVGGILGSGQEEACTLVGRYPITISTASWSTLWPAVTSTLRTTPERTARISFSIFIASRIISG